MKFTKIIALALALVMLVCAVAACGGPDDTTPADTKPVDNTTPADTKPADTEPANDCPHSRKMELPNKHVDPTCTTDGRDVEQCRSCKEEIITVIPASHKYSPLMSVDGAYTKHICTVCADVYVVDADGAKVEDYSAIEFPIFLASFNDITSIKQIADKFDGFSYKDDFAANVVNYEDEVESISYVNVPTGTSIQNPNGYFEINDDNNQFAEKEFTVSFLAEFEEYPLTGYLNLLTWGIGGEEYVLIKIDGVGNVYVIGNDKAVATYLDKGWDELVVTVNPVTGDVKVTFTADMLDKDAKVSTGTGKLGTSVTGKTGSYLRFFDDEGQFEAGIDEILFSVAK